MTSLFEQRSEVTLEIMELSRLQSAAVENAAYAGWSAEAKDRYAERGKRLELLGQRLDSLR